jgi:Fe-S cluster assembly protein SufB
LIVVEPGAKVHYLEGCSSPIYSTNALHAAVVEIVVGEGAECRYTTVQNWSADVFNLVTKRARVEARGRMIWTDANVGSKITQKYPSCYLVGDGAHGEVTSLSFAGPGQLQDTGAKMVHVAPNTTSTVVAKSVSRAAGRTNYRGLVRIEDGATGARSHVRCDTLLLDEESAASTYPTIENNVEDAVVEHEASVSKVSEDQLFYLRSRGLSENQARSLIVAGFAAEVAAQLPAEYSVELTRLLELETEGSVG